MDELIKRIKNYVKNLKENDPSNVDLQKIDKLIIQRIKEEEDKKERGNKKVVLMDIQNYLSDLSLHHPLNDVIKRVKGFVETQIEEGVATHII